jgi:tetratricopeptide (TPR) repeat protein
MRPAGFQAALLVVLTAHATAWAGVHHLPDPSIPVAAADPKEDPHKYVQMNVPAADPLAFVRQIDVLKLHGRPDPFTKDSIHRLKLLRLVEYLRKKPQLSIAEQVNLGAYLLRLGEPAEAVRVLERAWASERNHFHLSANLGTAYQQASRPDDALRLLQEAMDLAPTEELRRHESYQLRLLRERRRAAERDKQTPSFPQEVSYRLDPLFPVEFVGESGRWEVGALAAAQRAKLPDDATTIVKQLLLWFPADIQLRWLFAELANARGDLPHLLAVQELYPQAFDSKPSPRLLRARLPLLHQAIEWRKFLGEACTGNIAATAPVLGVALSGSPASLPGMAASLPVAARLAERAQQGIWGVRLTAWGSQLASTPGAGHPIALMTLLPPREELFLDVPLEGTGDTTQGGTQEPGARSQEAAAGGTESWQQKLAGWFMSFGLREYLVMAIGGLMVLGLLAFQFREALRRRPGRHG